MINIIALYIILGIILAVYIVLRFSVKISYYVNSKTDELELSAKWLCFQIYPGPDKPPKEKKKKNQRLKVKRKQPEENSPKNVQDTLYMYEIDKELTDETEAELDEKIEALEKELESQNRRLVQNSEKPSQQEKINAYKIKSREKHKKKHLNKSSEDKTADGGLKAKIKKAKKTWNKYKDYVPMTWKAFRKLLKQIRFYDTEIEITAGKDDAYDAAMLYGKLNTALFNGLGMIGAIFSLHKPKRAEIKCVFDEKIFEYKVSGRIRLRPSTILAIAICFGVKFLVKFLKKRHKAKKEYKLKRKLMLNKQKELLANEG